MSRTAAICKSFEGSRSASYTPSELISPQFSYADLLAIFISASFYPFFRFTTLVLYDHLPWFISLLESMLYSCLCLVSICEAVVWLPILRQASFTAIRLLLYLVVSRSMNKRTFLMGLFAMVTSWHSKAKHLWTKYNDMIGSIWIFGKIFRHFDSESMVLYFRRNPNMLRLKDIVVPVIMLLKLRSIPLRWLHALCTHTVR